MMKHIPDLTLTLATLGLAVPSAQAKSKKPVVVTKTEAKAAAAVLGSIIDAASDDTPVHSRHASWSGGLRRSAPLLQASPDVRHVAERTAVEHAPSFALTLDGGSVRLLETPEAHEALFGTLRVMHRRSIDGPLGLRASAQLRFDQVGGTVRATPGLGLGLGLVQATSNNTSLTVDMVAVGLVGSRWTMDEQVHLAGQFGTEFGFWGAPSADNDNFAIGIILRGVVSVDSTRGWSFDPSLGLAFKI